MPSGVPPHWGLYVTVSDVDQAVEAALAAGGSTLCPPMDVPGVGQLSLFEDPDGRVLGMWKRDS